MNTVEILTKAKQLIADPLNWTQGTYTEERDGNTCYCALGAIGKVTGSVWFDGVTNYHASKVLRSVVAGELKEGFTFAPYNDSHTHSEVMEAFDKAIALAQASGE